MLPNTMDLRWIDPGLNQEQIDPIDHTPDSAEHDVTKSYIMDHITGIYRSHTHIMPIPSKSRLHEQRRH